MLKGIKEIYCLGHSMSTVDRKYFIAVAESINVSNVKWNISYYNDDDIENAKVTLQEAGIDMKLVSFKRLQDFFSKQLELF